VVVAVGDSRITTPAGENAPETIQIALRPEDLAIVMDSAGAGDQSLIAGTIEKSIFTGAQVRYTITCGDELSLVVERHRPEREAIIPEGTQIMVNIPAGAPMSFHPKRGSGYEQRPKQTSFRPVRLLDRRHDPRFCPGDPAADYYSVRNLQIKFH
jgi:hypothetical protein